MDRLTKNNAAVGKYIVWDRQPNNFSEQLVLGIIIRIGGPVVDEWANSFIWIRWDDCEYVLEYDESLIPEKVNFMASRHVLERVCGTDIYVFDTEKERLFGILKLSGNYGS